MPRLTSNTVFLEKPELFELAISNSLTSMEEIQDTKKTFDDFIEELEHEWTPERIKHFLVNLYRKQYHETKKLMEKTELENRDARVRGKSYKERESTFTVKLKIGTKLLQEIHTKGNAIKSKTFSVREMVSPTDMKYIKELGFERFLGLIHS